MEQDRNPRDKPTHLWVPYLRQRQIYKAEKTASSISAEKLDSYMLQSEIRTFPNTIHKNNLKMG